jgi:hypothetical protein
MTGNKASRGRKPRQTEDAYLTATMGSVSLKDWRAVVDKALAQAKAGDHRAREFLSRWLLPPPGQPAADVDAAPESITINVVPFPDAAANVPALDAAAPAP